MESTVVEYAITNKGIWADRLFYPWRLLEGYKINNKGNFEVVRIKTLLPQTWVTLIVPVKDLSVVEYALNKALRHG